MNDIDKLNKVLTCLPPEDCKIFLNKIQNLLPDIIKNGNDLEKLLILQKNSDEISKAILFSINEIMPLHFIQFFDQVTYPADKESSIIKEMKSTLAASNSQFIAKSSQRGLFSNPLFTIGKVVFVDSAKLNVNFKPSAFKVNGHHMRGTSEKELLVWNECARLLANSLLYYNAVMLDKWQTRCERRGEKQKCEFIRCLSPVAWTHVNFHGIYEFLTAQMRSTLMAG